MGNEWMRSRGDNNDGICIISYYTLRVREMSEEGEKKRDKGRENVLTWFPRYGR